MTQDKENKEPSTIVFRNSNVDWVMRITADRRIEVNEDVEVTEAAQKVLDAMQQLLKAQRTWIGLTLEQYIAINSSCATVDEAVGSTERQLKENNT
jgi:hypothetical protein